MKLYAVSRRSYSAATSDGGRIRYNMDHPQTTEGAEP